MMEIIYGGRKTGRTQHLINMAAEAEKAGEVSYIVCGTHDQAYQIARRAGEQGLVIRFPITYDEFLRGEYHGKRISKFFIDNADHLLQSMTSVTIIAVTMEKKSEAS